MRIFWILDKYNITGSQKQRFVKLPKCFLILLCVFFTLESQKMNLNFVVFEKPFGNKRPFVMPKLTSRMGQDNNKTERQNDTTGGRFGMSLKTRGFKLLPLFSTFFYIGFLYRIDFNTSHNRLLPFLYTTLGLLGICSYYSCEIPNKTASGMRWETARF